ncbi:UvrD-helicase domain-containing protein [Antrihabitans cavernicola]|uniref:RecBCD enzyme subunit RecB n=1 Tax=Antrihabitans cavernicola TaxID=2495913 RepID=A0A5A7S4R2_9NOCA|nr:UvrD-helicase domain-containing protein [Spelaeibacter cavernicola]KAA0020077.1 AAA family ATPase [Spelaeibacter cavernicola]
MGRLAEQRDGGSTVSDFDLLAPLPTGTTILEASAGTGKTYAIVGLATRFIADGVADVSQLLLVTFSRAATQELRERTRARFSSAASELADTHTARMSPDPLIRYLADAEPDVVAVRRIRLLRALSDFDAGTIATTHSFCQRMLDTLGIAGERETDVRLVEGVDDLITEVVDDLYLRKYSRLDMAAPMSASEAMEVAKAAIGDRQAALAPEHDDETEAGHRRAFAAAAKAEVQRRKQNLGLRDFDDLLELLRDVLADPMHGAASCARIQERYRVVLVDEFQDTDPLQWEIVRRAFHGTTTLVLVGDPKQAIYAFRGAEVLSYLDAARHADALEELGTNWRSDAGLLRALGRLYGGAALGHRDIVVHPVAATHTESRLTGTVPLRIRHLPRTGAGPLNKSGYPAVGRLRTAVATDVGRDIVGLLSSGATLAVDGPSRPVQPGDIAVLVRTRAQVALVRDALDRSGIPSVLASGTSVFETASATHWLWFLQALEQPHRSDRVRLAALTPLLGWTAAELDGRGDDAVASVGAWLRELATLFGVAGFAAVFERVAARDNLESRLLARESGERELTDLRHIAQLLNRATVSGGIGLTSLTRWLTERIEDPASGDVQDRSRRLDSDAAAVQIATIHASKGLEFPIVYVPFAWDAAKNPNPSILLLHGPDGERVLDVGGATGPGYAQRKQSHHADGAGEELRLLYVALTRAMCQVVLWWAPAFSTAGSPLHRLMFARGADSPEPDASAKIAVDSVMASQLSAWPGPDSDVVSIEPVADDTGAHPAWTPVITPVGELAAADFRRELDMEWRRTSYSALTASAHDSPGVGSEAETPEKTDEPDEAPPIDDVLAGTPSPMNGLPAGAAFGTLVHEVLEVVDTDVPDLATELRERCRDAVESRLADVDPDALAAALLPVMRTPVSLTPRITLADMANADRLAELDFELPLAGGDDPVSDTVTVRAIAGLLRHHLAADDSVAPYADQLAELDAVALRGYLTGSIDAVLRMPGPTFVVVDYKTNRLGLGDLTVEHYTHERMTAEMMRAHYPLQALLYSVALHRYLRWRLPDYDPAVHLGGIAYLFVRGMVGADTPAGCGVFDWRPPATLVTALSDLLAGS